MRRYQLYTAMICVAAGLAAGGCAANAQAENLETSAQETSAPETTVEDTVVETVTGAIESMEESQPQELGLIRIFGPVTKMEEGRLSMNRQDVAVEEGQEDEIPANEIVLNLSEEVYILDASTGMPVAYDEIEDGSTVYAYIGPAMTMSLPPQSTAEMLLVNVPSDFKVPDYVEVKSMVTDGSTGESVLTASDGTEYVLAEDCNIFPYLTRNIVTLDDLTQGRKCLVWSAEDNTAEKIMVFAAE